VNRRPAMRVLLLSLLLLPVPAALAAGEIKLPAYRSATLPNGAVVALVEKRDTPLVSMNVTVRGGGLGDPVGKDGGHSGHRLTPAVDDAVEVDQEEHRRRSYPSWGLAGVRPSGCDHLS